MKAGIKFHKMAENFHRNLDIIELVRWGPELYLEKFKTGNKEFDLFIEVEKQRYNILNDADRPELFKPLAVERKLIGRVAGYNFIGYVDRVDEYVSGELAVLDYKTKYPKNDSLTELRRQLTLYAELVEAADGTKVQNLSAYFYKEGTGLSQPIKPVTRTALRKWIAKKVDGIQNEVDFPKCDSNWLCKYCTYKEECEMMDKAEEECSLNLGSQSGDYVDQIRSF